MAQRRWAIFRRQPIHEATQRAWCRLVFVLAGALPVILTLMICCAEFLPGYQTARVRYYERELSLTLGLNVQIERVELLTPSRRLLHKICLQHPETGEPLGQVRSLWISETSTGCAIHAAEPVLVARHIHQLYQLLHDQVLCRPNNNANAAVLWLDGLAVRDDTEAAVVFRKLHIELKRLPNATAAAATIELADIGGQPASLAFKRKHDDEQPTSHISFSTGTQQMPGSWVQRFAPPFSVPGSDATFTGTFDLAYNQTSWQLRGTGRMHDVDAATWFERPVISGSADVDITRFSMSDLGLKEAAGQLTIQEGRINSELLTAAQAIGISAIEGPASGPNRMRTSVQPFKLIALGFQLDNSGLKVAPILPNMAIAVDPVGPIAQYFTIPNIAIPKDNLVVCLSLSAPSEVLKTATAQRLLQWLPGGHTVSEDRSTHQASQ